MTKNNLTPDVRFQFLRLLAKENPDPSVFDSWLDEKAEQFGVSSRDLRRYIGEQVEAAERATRHARGALPSITHQVAESIGLSRAKIFQRVNEALDATKTIVRKGRIKDEDGNSVEGIIFQETVPDWDVILQAAREGAKILGAHEPTRVEIEHEAGPRLEQMSIADIATRLLEIKAKLTDDPQVRAALAEQAEANARAITAGDGASGPQGDSG